MATKFQAHQLTAGSTGQGMSEMIYFEQPNYVEFEYPRREEPEYLCVDLTDIRAAKAIRIHYDFDRDGWSIETQRTVGKMGDLLEILEYAEVAFVPAWALHEEEE